MSTQQNPHDTLFTVALAQTVDAYDPAKPNDYFEYIEERKKALAKMKEGTRGLLYINDIHTYL
jgi:hypothetical protein